MTILTKQAILDNIDKGYIVADRDLVQENSVNFTLGNKLFERDLDSWLIDLSQQTNWKEVHPTDDDCFILEANKVYIAITGEVVGTFLKGDGVAFVPEMRARSTTGRHGLTVARCAGVGDVGYCGIWAVELFNHNSQPVKIPIGCEIGQFVFHEATEAYPENGYGGEDRYQTSGGIKVLPKPYKAIK